MRTGSRGLFWLEPMVEVETPRAASPTARSTPADAAGLLDADCSTTAPHPLRLGVAEEIPWLKRQTRLTFARCGIIDPLLARRIIAPMAAGKGLERALALGPAAIVEEVTAVRPARPRRRRLPDRHQMAAPWRRPQPQQKYIVCNADEGDSGTFADRMIMEGDPFVLIEGMAIAGIAVGATKGYVYIRSEYPHAVAAMEAAIAAARARRLLGAATSRGSSLCLRPRGAGRRRRLCLRRGDLAARKPGRQARQVRAKPPLPAHQGPVRQADRDQQRAVARHGAVHPGRGRRRSIAISAWAARAAPCRSSSPATSSYGGLFETAFGITLGELVDDIGGGTATGRPVRAVQVGGPLGAYFPRALFDTPFDYEAFAARDGLIGHGGIVVFDDTVDMAQQARFAMEFCAIESCGKCTPCRIGSTRGVEMIDRIIARRERAPPTSRVLDDLCNTMKFGSLCALGGFTPYPVMSALTHFPEDFGAGRRGCRPLE